MLADIFQAAFDGMSWAMATFLVASGLTLGFGLLHILNLAHGGFFMIGAFLSFTIIERIGPVGLPANLAVCLAAGAVVAGFGLVTDRLVFRRLRGVDDSYVLIATYALLLVTTGATKLVWGNGLRSVEAPAALDGAVVAGDLVMPIYSLSVIAAGAAVFASLWWCVNRTPLGETVRCIARDPWMCRLLGVDVDRIRTGVVVATFFLAGLAGGVLAANQSLSTELGATFLMQALGAVIVGGMGSVSGTFVAAIVLGMADSFGTWLVPDYPGVWFYVALVGILVARPRGLFAGRRAS